MDQVEGEIGRQARHVDELRKDQGEQDRDGPDDGAARQIDRRRDFA